MVYPTISNSPLTILNVRCEMDPSKVNSINTVLSIYNPLKLAVIMIDAFCSEVAINAYQ